MSRLEQRLKDKYPNHRLYDKWDFELQQFTAEEMMYFAEEYAKECSSASLEKASESALVKHSFPGNSETSKAIGDGNQVFTVDKELITNPENIILL